MMVKMHVPNRWLLINRNKQINESKDRNNLLNEYKNKYQEVFKQNASKTYIYSNKVYDKFDFIVHIKVKIIDRTTSKVLKLV